MQRLLSSYANRYARCHRRPGHLFQGRFKGELIEDEGYFWSVSRYVEQGLERPPKNPLAGAAHGWLLGGKDFVDRIRREMKDPQFVDEVPRARTLRAVDVESVFEAVTDDFDVDLAILSLRGDGHIARAVAAWLARRLTTATLRELAGPLGLGRPESVSNLTRRVDRGMAKNSQIRKDLRALESRIARNTKNKV